MSIGLGLNKILSQCMTGLSRNNSRSRWMTKRQKIEPQQEYRPLYDRRAKACA